MNPEEEELESLLTRAIEQLRQVRGNPDGIRDAIKRYLAEGRAQERSPLELRDYFDISTPGLAEEAGYSAAEQDAASTIFEEVSREWYDGRPTR